MRKLLTVSRAMKAQLLHNTVTFPLAFIYTRWHAEMIDPVLYVLLKLNPISLSNLIDYCHTHCFAISFIHPLE